MPSLLLNLIRTHALLHQASRDQDERGRVIATLQDYAAIYALVADDLAEGVHASVPATVRETVEAVATIALKAGVATVLEVAQTLKLDHSAASRRCRTAQNRGYIQKEEISQGRPARYVPANPLPAEEPVLPTPDKLAAVLAGGEPQASVCTSAEQMEWDSPPPPSDQAPGPARRRIVL